MWRSRSFGTVREDAARPSLFFGVLDCPITKKFPRKKCIVFPAMEHPSTCYCETPVSEDVLVVSET
jgi:hypothetical protein